MIYQIRKIIKIEIGPAWHSEPAIMVTFNSKDRNGSDCYAIYSDSIGNDYSRFSPNELKQINDDLQDTLNKSKENIPIVYAKMYLILNEIIRQNE